MDSDQGKLFVGGISWETDEEKLKGYFQGYGEVVQAVVMRDKLTGKPRGFGFVVFSDPSILDTVVQNRHVIDGRTVEAKRALSREDQVPKSGNSRTFGGGGDPRTKKIFVGGLPATLTEDEFRHYFETYGMVTDVVIMYDQQTNRPRGFGFISFDTEEAVDSVLHKTFHDLNGKQVEVKRATPKDGSGARSMGPTAGYQGYGSSSNSYDQQLGPNRYTQNGGGYPSYGGASGYNMPGYGYPPANNGMGYGYGNYSVPPAAGGGYGNVPNPSNAAAAYGQRNPWGSQAPSPGYGYNGGSGQSPGGGASGYGSQGFGYGGSEGGYGNQGGYNGRVGSGYGDGNLNVNGNSGYGNSGWRSDQ